MASTIRANETGTKMTFKAAADLSSYQYCFVKMSAADTVNVCGAGETPCGILQNKPDAAGKGASVVVLGPSMLQVDGSSTAVTRSCYFKSAASGVGAKTTTDTDEVGAKSFSASSASGDVIPVLVIAGTFAG